MQNGSETLKSHKGAQWLCEKGNKIFQQILHRYRKFASGSYFDVLNLGH